MKGFQRLFLLFAAVCFILSAASFASSINRQSESTAASASDPGYVLRSDNGIICVYSDYACTERIGILNVRPDDLPPEERSLLECGLLIENEEQLLSLIEDYTG